MDGSCEFPRENPSAAALADIIAGARTIAVVGLSDSPVRESHRVAAYLQANGYRIIPVNPMISEALGEKAWAHLREVPVHIDIVDIFRRPEYVPEIVEAAIEIGASAIWMQSGIVNNAAADRARAAGLRVVMDRCLMVEHARLRDKADA